MMRKSKEVENEKNQKKKKKECVTVVPIVTKGTNSLSCISRREVVAQMSSDREATETEVNFSQLPGWLQQEHRNTV